jgi:hypothetical protein
MSAYCEETAQGLCFSRSKMTKMSEHAEIWIDGFLAGNEPRPPESGDAKEEEEWDKRRQYFRRTGESPPLEGFSDPATPLRYRVKFTTRADQPFEYSVVTRMIGNYRDRSIAIAAAAHSSQHADEAIDDVDAEFVGEATPSGRSDHEFEENDLVDHSQV